MTIQVGDKLPEAKFRVMTAEGPQVKTTDDIFKGRKVALFAVPGAYTGTCHKMHLPSIFLNAYAIKDKGVSTIAIASDAATPGAIKMGENMRATTSTITVFASTTMPGFGVFARTACSATAPLSTRNASSAGK